MKLISLYTTKQQHETESLAQLCLEARFFFYVWINEALHLLMASESLGGKEVDGERTGCTAVIRD